MDHSEPNTSRGKFKLYGATTFIFVTGLVLGYLVMLQAHSVNDLNALLERDRENNVFREMQMLNEKNEELADEIKELETTLDQYSHRASYLQAVEDEIKRYQLLVGSVAIEGPGVMLKIDVEQMQPLWFIDIVNELLNGGSEAISINGIRLVEGNNGFDLLPNGEILINGTTISGPYEFKVIGPVKELEDALKQQGGVLLRLEKNFPKVNFSVEKFESLKIEAVL